MLSWHIGLVECARHHHLLGAARPERTHARQREAKRRYCQGKLRLDPDPIFEKNRIRILFLLPFTQKIFLQPIPEIS